MRATDMLVALRLQFLRVRRDRTGVPAGAASDALLQTQPRQNVVVERRGRCHRIQPDDGPAETRRARLSTNTVRRTADLCPRTSEMTSTVSNVGRVHRNVSICRLETTLFVRWLAMKTCSTTSSTVSGGARINSTRSRRQTFVPDSTS